MLTIINKKAITMQRLSKVNAQFGPTAAAGKLTKDSLSVVDNRTGKHPH